MTEDTASEGKRLGTAWMNDPSSEELTPPIDGWHHGAEMNRREFMAGTALAVAAAGIGADVASAAMTPPSTSSSALPLSPVRFRVNGEPVALEVDTRASLLDTLRERLGLTGAKKGCDHGQCGACTVHLDGRRVVSCLTLAVQVDGRDVFTIEGLAPSGTVLHPMQQAFIDHDALQCGYCTPGQIMAAVACVQEGNATSAESIREYMSGNLCRCGAYVGIVAAIQDAAPRMGKT